MDASQLVIDDRENGIFRYHRSALTSQEVLDLEHRKVFGRCWLYLGHGSEIENVGEYRRRTVGGRPLFFVRGADGQVRVFLNACRHRGALVCRSDEGSAEVFQCFYHAWTYNNKGELIGMPDEDGYPDSFHKSEMGLLSPPKVDNYRGFYFVNYDPDAVDLQTYLGEAREYIDLVEDQAESGMRVLRGSDKCEMKANWKLMVENSVDGYHAFPVHQTFFEYVHSLWPEMPRGDVGVGKALGNGHAVMEYRPPSGRPIALWTPLFSEDAKDAMADTRSKLVEKYGEAKAHRMCDLHRNLLIYPNLILNDVQGVTIRYFEPLAPDRMMVRAWQLAAREEEGSVLATRLDSYITFLGSGGFATPDDSEALESCQAGFAATEVEWSLLSRGMKRDPINTDELQVRTFWRRWHADLMGRQYQETGDALAATPADAIAT